MFLKLIRGLFRARPARDMDRDAGREGTRTAEPAGSPEALLREAQRLAEAGSHLELLKRDGLYAEMWARQAAEKDDFEEAAE